VLGAGLNVLVSGSEIFNITMTSLMLDGVTESLAALGITIAGIAIIVERRWQGWRRYMPLLSALYVWLVITPAAPVSQGGPALHWAVAGGGVITVLLGVALYVEARQVAQAAPAF
jgi:Sec-independent protein secretion pathway component TatC